MSAPWKSSDIEAVLIVDDEYHSVAPLIKLLQQARIPFKHVTHGFDAIRELSRGKFRLVFMDLYMPELTGVETLSKADLVMGSEASKTPVIFYSSGELDSPQKLPLKHLSIVDSWNKSMTILKLHSHLNRLLSNQMN
jgi:CheY-like chemotaxis protein